MSAEVLEKLEEVYRIASDLPPAKSEYVTTNSGEKVRISPEQALRIWQDTQELKDTFGHVLKFFLKGDWLGIWMEREHWKDMYQKSEDERLRNLQTIQTLREENATLAKRLHKAKVEYRKLKHGS